MTFVTECSSRHLIFILYLVINFEIITSYFRSAEKELVADTEPMTPGTEWERIAKLCDFNPKASKHTKDISRMRSIILQVKQTPPGKALTNSN